MVDPHQFDIIKSRVVKTHVQAQVSTAGVTLHGPLVQGRSPPQVRVQKPEGSK